MMFAVLLAAFSLGAAHEYYVSIFVMDYNEEEQRIEATIKVFSDDLETVLNDLVTEPYSLEDNQENSLVHTSLAGYLSHRVSVRLADGQILELEYLGYEQERDMTYIFFQSNVIDDVKGCTIKNTWLMDFFPDQVNYCAFLKWWPETIRIFYAGSTPSHFRFSGINFKLFEVSFVGLGVPAKAFLR